jgi:hypothetical protein
VATCTHCGVGLCLEHLAERESHSAGGTRLDCPHQLPGPDDPRRWEANLQVAGYSGKRARSYRSRKERLVVSK